MKCFQTIFNNTFQKYVLKRHVIKMLMQGGGVVNGEMQEFDGFCLSDAEQCCFAAQAPVFSFPPILERVFSTLFLSLADEVESQAINMVLLHGLQLNKYLWCTEVLDSILLVCSEEKAWNPWGDPWSALLCRAKAQLCFVFPVHPASRKLSRLVHSRAL